MIHTDKPLLFFVVYSDSGGSSRLQCESEGVLCISADRGPAWEAGILHGYHEDIAVRAYGGVCTE